MADLYYNRGTYKLAVSWILSTIALIIVAARLYSRLALTQSIGSDDFTIVIPAVSQHSLSLGSCPKRTK